MPDRGVDGREAIAGGRYDLLRRLQRTASGETFRARDTLLDRVVTVVVHHGVDGPDEEHWSREIRALHEVDHAGVAELCDGGLDDGVAYSVLRVVGARTLRDVGGRRASPEQVARWCGRLGAGLRRLHDHGFTHGAVGADTVLLDDGDAAYWFRLSSAVHDDRDPAGRESDVRALRELAVELIGVPPAAIPTAELDALLCAAGESSRWLLAGPDDVQLDRLATLVRRARRVRWRSGWRRR